LNPESGKKKEPLPATLQTYFWISKAYLYPIIPLVMLQPEVLLDEVQELITTPAVIMSNRIKTVLFILVVFLNLNNTNP